MGRAVQAGMLQGEAHVLGGIVLETAVDAVRGGELKAEQPVLVETPAVKNTPPVRNEKAKQGLFSPKTSAHIMA